MKAPQMVYAMAEYFKETEVDVRAVDRALAENGLRSLGRGVNAPDVSIRDALRILLGLMGARKYTRAHRDVADMERFTMFAVKLLDPLAARVAGLGVSMDALKRGMPLLEVLERVCLNLPGDGDDLKVWLEVREGGWVELQFSTGDLDGEIVFSGTMDTEDRKVIARTSTVGRNVLVWLGRMFTPAESVEA